MADGQRGVFRSVQDVSLGGHVYGRPVTKPVAGGTVLVGFSTDEQVLGVDFETGRGELARWIFAEPPDAGEFIGGVEFRIVGGALRHGRDPDLGPRVFQAGEVPNVAGSWRSGLLSGAAGLDAHLAGGTDGGCGRC